MKTSVAYLTLTACLACALVLPLQAVGGTSFFDDFEDGNFADGNPVTWSRSPAPLDAGTVEVLSGDLVVTPSIDVVPYPQFPNYHEFDLVVEDQLFHDVTIQTRVRALDLGMSSAGVAALDTLVTDGLMGSSVYGFLVSDGRLVIGHQRNSTVNNIQEITTDISIAEGDVNLKLTVHGELASVSAWPEGSAEPVEPQLTTRLPTWLRNQEGRMAIFAGSLDPAIPIAFQFVEVRDGMTVPKVLKPGDADQDLDFDQLDLVHVQQVGKYLTGRPATWGEGDWNGAPGGTVGSPPPGDSVFNQLDIITALNARIYLTGSYGAVKTNPDGAGKATLVYYPTTGELAVQAGATQLTSINIDSAARIFTGAGAQNLGGSFDNDSDNNIFKATFGSSFGSLTFGNVAQAGLSKDFVLNDLTVVGSLAGGGDLGEVDLIYVPEPSVAVLAVIGLLSVVIWRQRLLCRESTSQ